MKSPSEHDLGLVHDLRILRRRRVLRLFTGAGMAAIRSPGTVRDGYVARLVVGV